MIKINRGFTLLEILIALFIFTLLSMMLMNALRHVINAAADTENKAERLRKVQMTLLTMSRDIEQAINRPIINSSGKEDAAFIGSKSGFTFTHQGVANSSHTVARSALQRAAYQWNGGHLIRMTWPVLDQSPKAKSNSRLLLSEIEEAHFEYADKNGRFYNEWPLNGQEGGVLPQAVRVYLTFAQWGTLTQLYLISAESNKQQTLGNPVVSPTESPKFQPPPEE